MPTEANQNPDEEWLYGPKDILEEKIERAFAQFERGEFLSAEDSRAEMEKRKAAWLANQRRP